MDDIHRGCAAVLQMERFLRSRKDREADFALVNEPGVFHKVGQSSQENGVRHSTKNPGLSVVSAGRQPSAVQDIEYNHLWNGIRLVSPDAPPASDVLCALCGHVSLH